MKGTKVYVAEKALEKSAAKRGLTGRAAAAYEYGTLNKIGLKRGNKTTPRGASKAKGGK